MYKKGDMSLYEGFPLVWLVMEDVKPNTTPYSDNGVYILSVENNSSLKAQVLETDIEEFNLSANILTYGDEK